MDDFNSKKKIVEYLKKNLKKGYTEESLKWALVNQGYSPYLVERAIEDMHKELAQKAPILKEKPTIKHEIIDEDDNSFVVKKSFFKRIFG